MPEFNPGDRVVYAHNRVDGSRHDPASELYLPAGITGTYVGTSNNNPDVAHVFWDDDQYNTRAGGGTSFCIVWKDNLELDMSIQLLDIVSEALLDAACEGGNHEN